MSRANGGYETVIGLEIHVQLKTETKLFCRCPVKFGAKPNSCVCPVCLGHPGVLPVVNSKAVDLAIQVAHATGSRINPISAWARKHYFYPDLPKGYQITQYRHPLIEGGFLTLDPDSPARQIRFHRMHLEEDAGKLIHTSEGDKALTLVDLNRCGTPLLEIVTEPDLATSAEAEAFLGRLKQLLQYTGASDAEMEKGQLRCDANISLRRVGTAALGIKTEIKNLNSFRNVGRALKAEQKRQLLILGAGGQIEPITLLWDKRTRQVHQMRDKEDSSDYRYFPEPDLPGLNLARSRISSCTSALPELPDDRRDRFIASYSLRPDHASLLTVNRALADYFEAVAREAPDPQVAANLISSNLLHLLKEAHLPIEDCPVSPSALAELLSMMAAETVNHSLAARILEKMFKSTQSAPVVAKANNWVLITDSTQIQIWVEETLAAHPEKVADYASGNVLVIRILIGEAMKRSGARAHPKILKQSIQDTLAELRGPGTGGE